MDGSRFVRCCILFLFVDVELSQEGYCISPSLGINDLCYPYSICLILSEFAANSSHYLVTNWSNASLSLFFLPGNHTLDRELTLARGDRFSMTKPAQLSRSVYVDCVSESGRFNISDTISVSIKGLHFIGCEGNSVTKVDQLSNRRHHLPGEGGEGRDRALVLSEVTVASITRETVWLPDGNVAYFKGKHISLVLVREFHIRTLSFSSSGSGLFMLQIGSSLSGSETRNSTGLSPPTIVHTTV